MKIRIGMLAATATAAWLVKAADARAYWGNDVGYQRVSVYTQTGYDSSIEDSGCKVVCLTIPK